MKISLSKLLPQQKMLDESSYEWIEIDNMYMGKFAAELPPQTLLRRGSKYRLYDAQQYIHVSAETGETISKHYKALYYKVSDKFIP